MFSISGVIAAAGLALGIFNSWWMFHSGRLQLEIVPCVSIPLPNNGFSRAEEEYLRRMPPDMMAKVTANGVLSLRIINKSSFAVDIVQCGFAQKKDLFYPRKAFLHPFAYSAPNGIKKDAEGHISYPIKLQSGEAIVLVDSELPSTPKYVAERGYQYAYAQTASNITCYKGLNSILSMLKVSPRT